MRVRVCARVRVCQRPSCERRSQPRLLCVRAVHKPCSSAVGWFGIGQGLCLRTNRGSHTATRGFGKPESSSVIESILDHGAVALGMDANKLRGNNMCVVSSPR